MHQNALKSVFCDELMCDVFTERSVIRSTIMNEVNTNGYATEYNRFYYKTEITEIVFYFSPDVRERNGRGRH